MFLVLVSLLAVAASAFGHPKQNIYAGPRHDPTPSVSCSDSDANSERFGQAEEHIKGKEYVITFLVCGFEKEDIEVSVKKGVLIVLAIQNRDKYGASTNALPENVNPTGKWLYDEGVLKIVFPLKKQKPSWNDVRARMAQEDAVGDGEEEKTSGDVYTPIANK